DRRREGSRAREAACPRPDHSRGSRHRPAGVDHRRRRGRRHRGEIATETPMAFPHDQDIATLCINTIRTLSIDAVQAANSGHPGTPMALAPLAYELWNHVLRFDPEDPIWPNRDRFVLSNGHASMLLWSLLHLTGVKAVNPDYEVLGQLSVKLEDIRRFRQIGS